MLRGRNRTTSLSMGLLSLTVTQITFLTGMLIGILFLKFGWLDGLQVGEPGAMISGIDVIYQPFISLANEHLPTWLVFLVGLGIIVLSFKLFDISIPKTRLKKIRDGKSCPADL